jgi:hypothetical protein
MRFCLALLATIIAALFGSPALAQTEIFSRNPWHSEDGLQDHVETDRDSFTPSTRTVGRHRCVTESSYSFVDNRAVAETHSLPELLVRYGISERVELRIGGNYEVGGEGADVNGGTSRAATESEGISQESQALYGLKFAVSEQSNWLPQSSLIVQGHTPMSGPEPATAFSMTYAFGWELEDDWVLDSAVRMLSDSEQGDRFEAWASSIVLRKTFAERWNVHLEYFSISAENRERDAVRQFVSPGAHWLITPDLEVGVRVGWGLNTDASQFFSNVGFGWRY